MEASYLLKVVEQRLMIAFPHAPPPRHEVIRVVSALLNSGDTRLIIGSTAIRDDDIAIFDALIAGAKAGGILQLGQADWAAIAALLVTILNVIRNLVKKGAELNGEMLAILVTLKKNPHGLSPSEIAALMSANSFSCTYDEAKVKTLLGRLTKLPRRDGSLVDLVVTDGLGNWLANGV